MLTQRTVLKPFENVLNSSSFAKVFQRKEMLNHEKRILEKNHFVLLPIITDVPVT